MLCKDRDPAAPLLEVIALDAADARAAQLGGADRVEVVADMAADGLTPAIATVTSIREACDLTLRVMLRDTTDFSADQLPTLIKRAGRLAAAGADGFVLGFLTPDGRLDLAATRRLAEAGGLPWTCHRVVDHAADHARAMAEAAGLPGVTEILTGGGPGGVDSGLDRIRAAARAGRPVMAGGGLRPEHVATLRAAGVRAFHVGSGVRTDWSGPVRPELVAQWRERLDAPVVTGAVEPG